MQHGWPDYRLLCPAVATVTYLTDRGGAPTVVFDAAARYRAMNPPSEPAAASSGRGRHSSRSIGRGLVSFPEVGKHIAFRGDLLHGVPAELIACDARPERGGVGGGVAGAVGAPHVCPKQTQ